MSAGQSRKFLPGLVFAEEESGDQFFLQPSDRDSTARSQLAMRSLGRQLAMQTKETSAEEVIRGIDLVPFQALGRRWLYAAVGGQSKAMLEANQVGFERALDQYTGLPRNAVALVINKFANQSTGATSPWLPQADALLLTDTVEAKQTAARLLNEALDQSYRQKLANLWSSTHLELAPPEYPEDVPGPSFHDGDFDKERNYRVVIELDNGKSLRFWPDELSGYDDRVNSVESWLLNMWKAPPNTKSYYYITDPLTSRRTTSGRIILADIFGEVFGAGDPDAVERMKSGETHRTIGDYIVFPVSRQGQPDGPQIFALRQLPDGSHTPIEVGENDAVVSRAKGYAQNIYVGSECILHTYSSSLRPKPAAGASSLPLREVVALKPAG